MVHHLPPPQTGSPWEWGLLSCVPPIPRHLEFSQQSLARAETQGVILIHIPSFVPACSTQFFLSLLFKEGRASGQQEGGG